MGAENWREALLPREIDQATVHILPVLAGKAMSFEQQPHGDSKAKVPLRSQICPKAQVKGKMQQLVAEAIVQRRRQDKRHVGPLGAGDILEGLLSARFPLQPLLQRCLVLPPSLPLRGLQARPSEALASLQEEVRPQGAFQALAVDSSCRTPRPFPVCLDANGV